MATKKNGGKKKNYVAIVRDHSGSMSSLRRYAARDYNDNVAALKEASNAEDQDTIASTIMAGVGYGEVEREHVNSNIKVLKELSESSYRAEGQTPLFDAVGEAIDILEKVPDATDPDVSFLVMVITDGQENASKKYRGQAGGKELGRRLSALQGTDHWTFAFRVPRGYAEALAQYGIPRGNILEWEQSDAGFQEATVTTRNAIGSFYKSRSLGLTSTKGFYTTDLSGVKTQTVKAQLIDISTEVKVWTTDVDDELIREFCERKSKKGFLKGAAFYQLVKTEKKVQDYKQIVIQDKKSGAFYSGQNARNLLGLPHTGEVKIVPGNHGMYDIFIQSTSVNRKLPSGTRVLYWEKVGTPYIEGKSSPWGK